MNKKVIISGVMMLVLLASCGVKEITNPVVETTINTPDVSVETREETMEKETGAMMDSKNQGEGIEEEMETMDADNETMMKDESEAGEVMEIKELAGVYTDYNANLLGKSDDTVIFFHASWCPSCKAADDGITSGTVPEGLSILKADFDTSTDLRKKYGVTGQHTFVQVDSDGNEIKKWVGGTSVEDIIERVQ